MAYHCFLSTENAFPDLAPEVEMVKMAWDYTNIESGLTPICLTSEITRIVSFFFPFLFILSLDESL